MRVFTDDETIIVRRVAEPPRKVAQQFARVRPVRWPIYVLFALILFAIGLSLAEPVDLTRRSRMSEHADELLKEMKR